MNAEVRAASYSEWLAAIRAMRWMLLQEKYAESCRIHQGQRKAWAELNAHVNLMLREGF